MRKILLSNEQKFGEKKLNEMRSISIYHITHLRNLESIIAKGGLICDSEMGGQGIGYKGNACQNFKERKARLSMPVSKRKAMTIKIRGEL